MDKYGVEYVLKSEQLREQSKKSCLDKYGVAHHSQCKEIRDKINETNMQRYGVIHISQNPAIAGKQMKHSYNLKAYTFPCGNIAFVQGYEPFLLNTLVREGCTYQNISTKRTEVPEIWYYKNQRRCRYYCDVYIAKTNTIYEVKSLWTYSNAIDDINLKKQACLDAGYNFELYVFDAKGIKQDV